MPPKGKQGAKPQNYGQQRSAQVHARNAQRKAQRRTPAIGAQRQDGTALAQARPVAPNALAQARPKPLGPELDTSAAFHGFDPAQILGQGFADRVPGQPMAPQTPGLAPGVAPYAQQAIQQPGIGFGGVGPQFPRGNAFGLRRRLGQGGFFPGRFFRRNY